MPVPHNPTAISVRTRTPANRETWARVGFIVSEYALFLWTSYVKNEERVGI